MENPATWNEVIEAIDRMMTKDGLSLEDKALFMAWKLHSMKKIQVHQIEAVMSLMIQESLEYQKDMDAGIIGHSLPFRMHERIKPMLS